MERGILKKWKPIHKRRRKNNTRENNTRENNTSINSDGDISKYFQLITKRNRDNTKSIKSTRVRR